MSHYKSNGTEYQRPTNTEYARGVDNQQQTVLQTMPSTTLMKSACTLLKQYYTYYICTLSVLYGIGNWYIFHSHNTAAFC